MHLVPRKTKKNSEQGDSMSFWVDESIHALGRWYTPNPWGQTPLCRKPSGPCRMPLFILLICVPYNILYNKLTRQTNVSLSSVNCANKLTEPEKGLWGPPTSSQMLRTQIGLAIGV